MTVMECLTAKQPTLKDLANSPKSVRDYIRALEKTLIKYIEVKP